MEHFYENNQRFLAVDYSQNAQSYMFAKVLSTLLWTEYANTQTRQKLLLWEERIVYRQIIAKYLLQRLIKATVKFFRERPLLYINMHPL